MWTEQLKIIEEKIAEKTGARGGQPSAVGMAEYLGQGVTRGKVQAWRKGQRPSADDLEIIARCLGLSADWLLLGEGPPERGRAGARKPEPPAPPSQADSAPQARHPAPESPLARELREVRMELEAAGFEATEIREALARLLAQRTGQVRYAEPRALREPAPLHDPPRSYPPQGEDTQPAD